MVEVVFGFGGERRDDAGSMFLEDVLGRFVARALRFLGVTGITIVKDDDKNGKIYALVV